MKNKLFFYLIIFLSCNTNNEKIKCKFGKPLAIFDKTMAQVSQHQFSLDANGSIETVFFDNGLQLELTQTGCEELVQTYTLYLEGDGMDKRGDAFWVQSAVSMFQFFASVDGKLASYAAWAGGIAQRASDVRLAVPLELEAGRFVKIDRITNKESAQLIVEIALKQ